MGVAKMTTPYQILKNSNLVTERVSIEFVWFEMSTAVGVGECFDFSESDVEVEMSSSDVEDAEDCADFGQGKRTIVSSCRGCVCLCVCVCVC